MNVKSQNYFVLVTSIGVCIGVVLLVFISPLIGLPITVGFLCRNLKGSVLAGLITGILYAAFIYYAVIYSRSGHSLHLLLHSYSPVVFVFCAFFIPVFTFIKLRLIRILSRDRQTIPQDSDE